jgi:hypothetical protein
MTVVLSLLSPKNVTSGGVTGGWVDMFGYNTRRVRWLLNAAPGGNPGSAGGSIQGAEDTAGKGLMTLGAFGTVTAAGGMDEQFFPVPPSCRYVRILGSVQSGKDMILHAFLFAQPFDNFGSYVPDDQKGQ